MIGFQFGEDITSPAPLKLTPLTLEELADAIRKPAYDLGRKTENLRRVGGIDNKAYQNLKKELPYVTCGIFNPPFRKTENFARIQAFILDFDHLSEKETNPETLKKRLQDDDRIALMFVSPGGDGLKVLFVLKEPFTDHGKYSVFYKLFAAAFANSCGMQQVIDKRTSDATRATFLCHDPLAWYNPLYQEIDAADWIDFESSEQVEEANQLAREQEAAYKTATDDVKPDSEEAEPALPDEVLEGIKRKLNPKYKPKTKKREFHVPEQVVRLETEIRKRCAEVGIEVVESESIQFGKQIAFKAGEHEAELNIFFGKKGYSVVKSTKTRCSEELNNIVYNLVAELTGE